MVAFTSAGREINPGQYAIVPADSVAYGLGETGAAGDVLEGLLIIPSSTSPEAVSVADGDGSPITVFPGGASSVPNLVPFFVPIGVTSHNGGWKVTTGTDVSVFAVGDFT